MSMHVCTTVDMWLSNTPASFTSRTALQITGNACFYHEIQQLFILITWSNQVCGYMQYFVFNLMSLCPCGCYTLDLEVKKLQTHTSFRATQSWWLSLFWILASPPPSDCSFTERVGSELCNLLAVHRIWFMSAETRHSRLCRCHLSHRDIFLADNVKGNDFVK